MSGDAKGSSSSGVQSGSETHKSRRLADDEDTASVADSTQGAEPQTKMDE